MISKTHFKSAKSAANYLAKEANTIQPKNAAAEYYAKDEVRSAWGGQGANLAGYQVGSQVNNSDLIKVLSGQFREPANNNIERQIGRIIDGKIDHRAGMDFTFSAPKSISIAAEIYDSAGVRTAHEAAVNAAMKYLETNCAQTRVNGQMVQTQNLVYAKFEHSITRELDPSTHTHVAIANVTYYEGKAYSLSNEELLRHRTTADHIYKNELAHELQKLGYPIEFDKHGNPELAGITAEQRAEFSERSKQIDAYLTSKGINPDTASSRQREIACLETRAGKHAPESAAMQREQWIDRAIIVGLKPPEAKKEIALAYSASAGKTALDSAVKHLGEREAAFSKQDIYRQAMRFSEGKATYDQVKTVINSAIKDSELIQKPDHKLTTEAAIKLEHELAERLEAGKNTHQAVMTHQDFDKALADFEQTKGFRLTDEQRAAASMILTEHHQHAGVQGLAGTGKTTMLEFVREAAESQGWTVAGFSSGSAQAQKMEMESGIKTSTTASYLQTQGSQHVATAPAKELRIMDEASMSGQREFNQVAQTADSAGAKQIYLGDKFQHQSVEAGAAFEQAQKHMPISNLEQISRQKTEHAKATVQHILNGKHAEAMRSLPTREVQTEQVKVKALYEQKHGISDTIAKAERINEARKGKIKTTEKLTDQEKSTLRSYKDDLKQGAQKDNIAVIKDLAKDYAALSPKERDATIVITATNTDRASINAEIRTNLKAAGEIKDNKQVETLQRKDMTKQQAKHATSFEAGDRVKFAKDYKSIGIQRGEVVSVVKVNHRDNTVTATNSRGDKLVFQPGRHETQAYTAQAKEIGAGDKIKFAENNRDFNVKNGQSATVERVEGANLTVKLENGSTKTIDTSKYPHIDHAYATTSQAAQGQSVSKTMVHHNVEAGKHNERETYVNATRAQLNTTLYTQDKLKAAEQAGLSSNKETATPEHTKQRENDKDRSL